MGSDNGMHPEMLRRTVREGSTILEQSLNVIKILDKAYIESEQVTNILNEFSDIVNYLPNLQGVQEGYLKGFNNVKNAIIIGANADEQKMLDANENAAKFYRDGRAKILAVMKKLAVRELSSSETELLSSMSTPGYVRTKYEAFVQAQHYAKTYIHHVTFTDQGVNKL